VALCVVGRDFPSRATALTRVLQHSPRSIAVAPPPCCGRRCDREFAIPLTRSPSPSQATFSPDITHRTLFTPAAPQKTATMTAKHTKKISVERTHAGDSKQETTKHWLIRRLRKPVTRQGTEEQEHKIEMRQQASLRRPQTAPSMLVGRPTVFPATVECPLAHPTIKPPPRPPRPDSAVIRDINVWLDASMIKSAPTLMAGLPYWREGAFTGSGPSADVRFAVPIIQEPEVERPTTSHTLQFKSFCRRAKRMQVRMPTLLRTKSQRVSVVQQKQLNRRSTSMPLLSLPNETHAGPTPRFVIRSRSLTHTTHRLTVTTTSPHDEEWLGMGQPQAPCQPQRFGSPLTVRFGEQEPHAERRIHGVFGHSTRTLDTMRPSTAGTYVAREDSMGNLSDAPTYVSGPPPPSYRSRTGSIVTTSSFGCIDGMSYERRQLRQNKAAQRSRGVKGKIKRLAQKVHLTG
jgi:hypothetical protein